MRIFLDVKKCPSVSIDWIKVHFSKVVEGSEEVIAHEEESKKELCPGYYTWHEHIHGFNLNRSQILSSSYTTGGVACSEGSNFISPNPKSSWQRPSINPLLYTFLIQRNISTMFHWIVLTTGGIRIINSLCFKARDITYHILSIRKIDSFALVRNTWMEISF